MNSQGRAIALATCYVLSRQSVLMTTCPEAGSFLQQHLEKYILYGDEAGTLLMSRGKKLRQAVLSGNLALYTVHM